MNCAAPWGQSSRSRSAGTEHCSRRPAATPRTAVWDVKTGKLVRVLRGGGPRGSSAVAFGLDGVTVALAGGDGNVRLYDLRTGVITGRMVSRGTLMDVDFSPDGKLIAAAGLAGDISVWKLARRELVAMMTNSGVAIYTLRFSPDGKLLASGDNSGNVIFWDVARHVAGRSTAGRPQRLSSAASRSIRAGRPSPRSAAMAISGSGMWPHVS